MQNLNAHAFIVAGMIRVFAGAETGGMAKYMTQFLWPQALGFIFIMAPAVMAPQWSRVRPVRPSQARPQETEALCTSSSPPSARQDSRRHGAQNLQAP